MNFCYTEEVDDSFILQGDIIVKFSPKEKETTIGMIITADCDVAQNKHGNRFNWIEIIPASSYIKNTWAKEKMQSIAKKHGNSVCTFLNATIAKTDKSIDHLSIDNLHKWIKESTPSELFSALSIQPEKYPKEFKKLEAIKIALCSTETTNNLSNLKSIYSALDRPETELGDHIKQALDNSASGFSDFFFLPGLPYQKDELGFVALFRHIYSIDDKDLFKNEFLAKINGTPPYFYRVGSFVDRIKFSIIQKMAFLFTRIGHDNAFEEACKSSIESTSEEIFNRS